jgi:hypothetical protein
VKVFRSLSFMCAFAIGAYLVFRTAARAVELSQAPGIALSLSLIDQTDDFARRLRESRGPDRVAFVGDSTCMPAHDMTDPSHQALPGRIVEAMKRDGERGRRASLIPMCVAGLGMSGVYFVGDRILAARPDRVVLSLNLRGFGPASMRAFGFAEASGAMNTSQVFESLRLPLSAIGLTADRMLFYKALFALDLVPQWIELRQLQGRLFNTRQPFAMAVEERLGVQPLKGMYFGLGIARLVRTQVVDRSRMSRELAEETFAPVLDGVHPDAPPLRFLRAALRLLRAAGIPTLVYIEPTNLEHLRWLGLPTDRVPESITAIAAVVREEGALLADFHAILPDAAFRDPGDHYTFEGTPNGTNLLAERIALAVTRDLLPAPPPGDRHAVQ